MNNNFNRCSNRNIGVLLLTGIFFGVLGWPFAIQAFSQTASIPKPNTPTHFKIEPGYGCAHLSWDAIAGANYWICISEDGVNYTPKVRKPYLLNEAIIFGLENGKKYYFSVAAISKDGNKSEAVIQTVLPDEITPIPTWVIPIKNIYYSQMHSPDPGEKDEARQKNYERRIRAHGETGGLKVIKKSEFVPKPEPNPPQNLVIEPGNRMARMTWDRMPNAIGYCLYISEDGKKFGRYINRPFKQTLAFAGNLDNDKTYYFGVVSIGPYGRESKMTIQTVVPSASAKIAQDKIFPASKFIK